MPTILPRQTPTLGDGIRLAVLVAAFHWHGFRRRAAARRMARIGADRGLARWQRVASRWLACSERIAALLGEPESPEVKQLRDRLAESRKLSQG
jgi:hypothetical protein